MARRFLCGFFRPLFSPDSLSLSLSLSLSSSPFPSRTVAVAAAAAATATAFFWFGRAARLRQIAFDLRNINLRNLLPVAGAGVATWPPIDAILRRVKRAAASSLPPTQPRTDSIPPSFQLLVVYRANNRRAITLPRQFAAGTTASVPRRIS